VSAIRGSQAPSSRAGERGDEGCGVSHMRVIFVDNANEKERRKSCGIKEWGAGKTSRVLGSGKVEFEGTSLDNGPGKGRRGGANMWKLLEKRRGYC